MSDKGEFTGAGMLERVIPFQFLETRSRERLASRLGRRAFGPGDGIIFQGEGTQEIFLLARGTVEVVDEGPSGPGILSTIGSGHYFGERAAIFGEPRRFTIRARDEVVAFVMQGADFMELIRTHPVFCHALARILRTKQSIFQPYDHFFARMLALLDEGRFQLSELTEAYRSLTPALHPRIHDERIDVGALAYALPRLTDDVTRVSRYFLTTEMDPLYSDPDALFEPVRTRARRRSAWRPIPGKLIVLVRDGISDVCDLLTCLCLYDTEARKIRRRLSDHATLVELTALEADVDAGRLDALLARCGLDDDERAGLQRLWSGDLASRLREIVLHHEDISFTCDMRMGNYNSRAAETWVSQIRSRARTLVDLDDPRLEVHVISSNTHSVGNCLSAYLGLHEDRILAWGAEHRPDLVGPDEGVWARRRDLVYALGREYVDAVPGARDEARAHEEASGRLHLANTALTGIAVDLIDPSRLDFEHVDPDIGLRPPEHPVLIVNVDYAFGQQAHEILSNLLFLFGRRVRSVSVLGKAGGLVGRRGDLLAPRETILQTDDELHVLHNVDLTAEALADLAPPGRTVHAGPVLTVAGTLLQDRTLLLYYRHLYRCVGLEMEGSYFARTLTTALATGILDPDVRTRFAYYVSDVPLDPAQNLSGPLEPWEGIPPLYAITRAVLRRVFS